MDDASVFASDSCYCMFVLALKHKRESKYDASVSLSCAGGIPAGFGHKWKDFVVMPGWSAGGDSLVSAREP